MDLQLEEQMKQFADLEEKHILLQQEKEAKLEFERKQARQRATEAAKDDEWKFKGRLSEQNRRFESEERKALQEARRRHTEKRRASAEQDREENTARDAWAEANFRL